MTDSKAPTRAFTLLFLAFTSLLAVSSIRLLYSLWLLFFSSVFWCLSATAGTTKPAPAPPDPPTPRRRRLLILSWMPLPALPDEASSPLRDLGPAGFSSSADMTGVLVLLLER